MELEEEDVQIKKKHILEEELEILDKNELETLEEDSSIQEEQDWVDYWEVLSSIKTEIKEYVRDRGLPLCETLTVADLHNLVDKNL